MRWYWGLVAVGAAAGIGAALGAATGSNFSGQRDPKFGATYGALTGVLLVGIAGLGATIAKNTRSAGIAAAVPAAGLLTAAAVHTKLHPGDTA